MYEWAGSVAFWVLFGLLAVVTFSSLITGMIKKLGEGIPAALWFTTGLAGIGVSVLFLLSRFVY